VDFIPGWIPKLRPIRLGKLLVSAGDVLGHFWSPNKGPLYFDGENITVDSEATLTSAVKPESVHEHGHLVLAKKVSQVKILPNGDPASLEMFEFGVQAVREIEAGQLLGLTKDNLSGAVRIDAISPKDQNLIIGGFPKGLRRLGFVETLVDGGCGKVPAKQFIDYQGAVFNEDEILLDKETGLPSILIPIKQASGEMTYTLGSKKIGVEQPVTQEQFEDLDLRIPVVEPIYGDAACPTKLTGLREFFIEFPQLLVDGYEAPEDPKGQDIIPVRLHELTGTNTASYDQTLNIRTLASLPAEARIVKLCLKASCGSLVTGNPAATTTVYSTKSGDTNRLYSTATCLAGQRDVSVFDIELNTDGTLRLNMVIVGQSLGAACEAWVLGYDY
jgi:hypothetical protein